MKQLTKLLTEQIRKTLFVIKEKYKHDYQDPKVVGVVELSYDVTSPDSLGRNQPKSWDKTQKEVLTFAKKRGLIKNTGDYQASQVSLSDLNKWKREFKKQIESLEDEITALSPNAFITEGKMKQLTKITEDIDTLKKEKDALTKQKQDLSAKRKAATTAPDGGDKTTNAELGKKVSDIGAKQADVRLKMTKEKEIEEGIVDSSVIRSLLMIAQTDKVAKQRNDATAAVEFAIETYVKQKNKEIRKDLERAKSRLIMGLQQNWKNKR